MANLACLISARRCHWSDSGEDAKLNGSKPRFPGVPSKTIGLGRNGRDGDMVIVDDNWDGSS